MKSDVPATRGPNSRGAALAEKMEWLRAELDRGIRSLDEGKGKPLDIEKFIRERQSP
jgi:hypothetical protein